MCNFGVDCCTSFGTYRTGLAFPGHAVALQECLRGGISLIDTSTNFLGEHATTSRRVTARILTPCDPRVFTCIQMVKQRGSSLW